MLISLDLDQAHLDIQCGRPHSLRLRVAPVLLICRSGKLSLEAGEGLYKEDFVDVLKVFKGFEGEIDDKHQRRTAAGWRFDFPLQEQC